MSGDRGDGRQSPAEAARASGLFFATVDKPAASGAPNSSEALIPLNRALLTLPPVNAGATLNPHAVQAPVTSHVHDSLTGRLTLIPAGTRLVGKYDSSVSFGQSRVLVVRQRLIWPAGRSLLIDNMPATDVKGFAGLSDRMDFNTASLLKGIGLSTLLGISGELGHDTDNDFRFWVS